METADTPETSMLINQIVLHIQEDRNLGLCPRGKFNSHGNEPLDCKIFPVYVTEN
jgi:hypothetical protein